MKKSGPRRPTAFNLDELNLLSADERPAAHARSPSLVGDPDPFTDPIESQPVALPPKPRWRWRRLLIGSLGGLVALGIGLSIDILIRDLFQRAEWLGWLAIALAGLAILALAALAAREIAALMRIRKIEHLRQRAGDAANEDDRAAAGLVCKELNSLYANRPQTARGRSALSGHMAEIIDGRDLIVLAETELLLPFDDEAKAMVLASAKRVALLTAISPRALIDLIFVGAEILRLIRQLAALYGGRPGFLGFLRLARAAFAHLAITGGMAAGDSILQQFLGHGIAARLSARLGEGVVNGILTARVGIAAIDVCRPLPFINGRRPRLSDIVRELGQLGAKKTKEEDSDPN